IFAMKCRHDFIDYVHLFGGLLTCHCSASYKLGSFSESTWRLVVEKFYQQTDSLPEDESIPLTKKAEKMIIQSFAYTKQTNSEQISSDHLLLALLSINNSVAQHIQKAGIVFEDICQESFPGIVIKKLTDLTVMPKKSNYSNFDKWLISDDSVEDKLNEWHYIANEFYEAEDYNQCIKACDIAQSLSNENPVFDILKAYAYYSNKNFTAAINSFLKLTEKFPAEIDYRLILANIYDEMGDYTEAAKINQELYVEFPSDAVLLNNIGFNLQLQKRYSEAILYYQSAIDIDPEFAYPYDNLGFCKYKLGEYEQGLSLINKALELDKGNSYAYKYKGIIFMENDNKEEASKNFQLALKFGYTKKYGNEVNEYISKIGL
ncbi:MAG: tetratricopeptide repeat protein, partial [Chitinophagaceae bacterium]|nr:tetratricopeptide repeat protein [Chitinophagaceae bacterium]